MNKHNLILQTVLAACLVIGSVSPRAEDIDLFVGGPPADEVDLPNVLFIVDNTANWGSGNNPQPFGNEKAALVNTFTNLPVEASGAAKFKVGVLFAAETGQNDNNISGGVVRAAMRPMTSDNKAKYAALFSSLDSNNDKGNGGASSLVMAEAYRYFSGGAPHAGNNKAKADYSNNACEGCNQLNDANKALNSAVWALPDNALSSKTATVYNNAFSAGCGKNYIIYISNGPSQDNNSTMTQAKGFLAAAGGDTTLIPLSPVGSQENPSDEWARFMKQSPLGVTVYTIDVNPGSTGQGPGWTALLKSMSAQSDGKYTAVNSSTGSGAEISDAINKALSEIQAVNGVFASVSLPVSVNTQGTYLNQVYVGMFRPGQNAYPRWAGNLKQYKLGFINNELRLQDADSAGAVNNLTGFVTECARSFWTPTTTDNYWAFSPLGNCITPAGSDPYQNSNFPDGNVVEKGAQGYVLRGVTERAVKTCSPSFGSCTTLTDFSTGNGAITQSLLNAASSDERNALINWQRGFNVDNEGGKGTNVIRPSAHGDIVHSRPVAINFGTDAAPKVVVFYGGNDGVFRAVNGNRTAAIGTVPAGGELWAFVPPEFYGKIKRIRDNTTQISFPNIPNTNVPTPLPKPYGVDGTVTAYNESGNAWIYTTMRRGGRAVYAFNVDVNNPANITLKWKKGCPNSGDNTDCTSDFSGIGQTWSAPKILKAAASTTPLLIMGGGYDTCEDADPRSCSNDSTAKGSRIYVLNADTGALLKTFKTKRSVIADVFVVPDQATGLAVYAYAVDLGGNIYRIDIGEKTPDNWKITTIASLGCATADASCTANRKFMFAPDVLQDGEEYILLLGSGDREKPLRYSAVTSVTNGVSNYFFMLRDKPTDDQWLSSETVNCGTAVICLNSLLGITTAETPSESALENKKGWYLGLHSTEQVVTAAITIFGTVTFSTHEPDAPQAGVCTTDLGTSRVYNVFYRNAESSNGTGSRYEDLPPVGLPPSPVAGMVTLDNGETVAFCIGCSADSPLEGGQPQVPVIGTPNLPKGRVYWHIEK